MVLPFFFFFLLFIAWSAWLGEYLRTNAELSKTNVFKRVPTLHMIGMCGVWCVCVCACVRVILASCVRTYAKSYKTKLQCMLHYTLAHRAHMKKWCTVADTVDAANGHCHSSRTAAPMHSKSLCYAANAITDDDEHVPYILLLFASNAVEEKVRNQYLRLEGNFIESKDSNLILICVFVSSVFCNSSEHWSHTCKFKMWNSVCEIVSGTMFECMAAHSDRLSEADWIQLDHVSVSIKLYVFIISSY